MNNINACFISYRHTSDPYAHAFVQKFVKQLRKQLSWWLPGIPTYFDEAELKVGDKFNEELACALCRSACMVMFFSPLHFDVLHPYCALEYHAMLDLERRRMVSDLRNNGLIFPIVFRGVECLPSEIKSSRTYLNFDYIVVESDFEDRDCQERLNALAQQIFERYKALCNVNAFGGIDCEQFRFPEGEAIREWLEQVSQIQTIGMPGR
jgi:hypothetical protein